MIMKARFDYKAGDTVRIKTGPFALFTGRVIEVRQDKSLLKVAIRFQNEWRILKLRVLDVEPAFAL
jgi:transcription antitermination factor NusG